MTFRFFYNVSYRNLFLATPNEVNAFGWLTRCELQLFLFFFKKYPQNDHIWMRKINTEDAIAAVEMNFREDTNESIRHGAQESELCSYT